MVVFLYDTRRRKVEPLDRSDRLEFSRRVPVQRYSPTVRMCSAVSRVIAAKRDSATQIDVVYRPNLETDKSNRTAVTAAAPSLALVEAQAIV